MNQLEENVVHSFRLAKSDIIKLQSEVIKLSQSQERLAEMLNALHKDEVNLYNKMKKSKAAKPEVKTIIKKIKSKPEIRTIIKTVKSKPEIKTLIKRVKSKPKIKTVIKTITKRANKVYVSSKDSNKFHLTNCPFAKNIKPKHREIFKSRIKTL